jgi:hypothetical protein
MTDVPTFPWVVGGLDVATDRFEGPLISLVTGHGDDENELSPEAQRKREQREREKAAGVEVIEVRISPGELSMLAEGRVGRGAQGEAYTATEYILTLIRRDNELLRQQQGVVASRVCEQCRKPLPRGCGGVWAGELTCAAVLFERAMTL